MTVPEFIEFCRTLVQMDPAEITRFTAWMAEELKESKAREAKAGE